MSDCELSLEVEGPTRAIEREAERSLVWASAMERYADICSEEGEQIYSVGDLTSRKGEFYVDVFKYGEFEERARIPNSLLDLLRNGRRAKEFRSIVSEAVEKERKELVSYQTEVALNIRYEQLDLLLNCVKKRLKKTGSDSKELFNEVEMMIVKYRKEAGCYMWCQRGDLKVKLNNSIISITS